jgi:hypothetical protein
MGNIRKVIIILIITVLFVSALAVTIVNYNGILNNKNSEIALLQSQISNQNIEIVNLSNQISDLNSQITNLSPANLTASLVIGDSAYLLNIEGSVTNTDKGTAYNAGLHVVAYTANGKLEINATVPLTSQTFLDPFRTWTGGGSSVTSLSGGQIAYIRLNIYHEGVVNNWTVTPVWTNTP